jgi:MoaA/NifB/PqqE/SkfB family radical SAM enzyme
MTKYGFESAAAAEFPPTIIMENTSVCNLRCIHCPHGQGWSDREDYHALYLDFDLYKKAIDEIAENKIALLRFAPEGEALVHPQFMDQIAYAKKKGISPLNLTTNGLTLDNPSVEDGKKLGKSMMERLLELGIEIIDISLDAANKESYEKIRVQSNYHRVWSNIHRLLYLREKMKAKTKIMLSIVDQPESHDEVKDFVKYWTPLVDRVVVRGYLTNLGLTPEKPGTVVDQMQGIKRWPCTQFWRRVTIGPDGSIRFCVVDWMDKTVAGHLKTQTIKEVWKSAEYDRMRKAHLEGRYADAHPICGPCMDWTAMRWDWGFEVAVNAVMGVQGMPSAPPPLSVERQG